VVTGRIKRRCKDFVNSRKGLVKIWLFGVVVIGDWGIFLLWGMGLMEG
jgi:hypothetical protein